MTVDSVLKPAWFGTAGVSYRSIRQNAGQNHNTNIGSPLK